MPDKILVLLGSGEFTSDLVKVDEEIISLASKNLKVPLSHLKIAILPTAAGRETDYSKWIDIGKSYFSDFGVKAFGIPAATRKDADRYELVDRLNDAQIVYISGGDPGYLLSCLRGSLLWEKIMILYDRGAVIVASSAGAMCLGLYTLLNPYKISQNSEPPIWSIGLSLTQRSIIPHYDYLVKNEPLLLEKIVVSAGQKIRPTLIGIYENTAVFQINRIFTKVSGLGNVTYVSKT